MFHITWNLEGVQALKHKEPHFFMIFSSKNLPEYLPLNDLVTRSKGTRGKIVTRGEREEKVRRKG